MSKLTFRDYFTERIYRIRSYENPIKSHNYTILKSKCVELNVLPVKCQVTGGLKTFKYVVSENLKYVQYTTFIYVEPNS